MPSTSGSLSAKDWMTPRRRAVHARGVKAAVNVRLSFTASRGKPRGQACGFVDICG